MIFGVRTEKILAGIFQTLYMTFVPLLIGTALGLVLAIILFLTKKGGVKENKIVYTFFSTIINIIRSVPFIILIVYMMPLTKMIVGTRVGSTAALVPLVCYITPYLARLIENALSDVDSGIIEAALSMGATTFQIVTKFISSEASSSIILGITTGAIGLLGATAMAGAVGGGGVGDIALTYGYQRFNTPLMTATVAILVVFVQLLQFAGSRIARRLNKK